MVAPSLKEKWPRDFKLFRERCLTPELAGEIRIGRAERAVQFLKLLDDPPERRASVIFLTHGAMSRGLADKCVMLALIYQALKHRWHTDEVRRALCRFGGRLLHMRWVDRAGAEIWMRLLKTPPAQWLALLHKHHVDPEGDDDPGNDDDPVPRAVWEVLGNLDTDAIYEALQSRPKRETKRFKQNLTAVRRALKVELRSLWRTCIRRIDLHLPLLILDEAHHLKNPKTRLASLFRE